MSCKLPRQRDTVKGEFLTSSWARYRAGGRPANASCGRSSLNPDDRRLVVRRYFMGQSVVGIARDLSTEPKALYRRYERILASLRKSAAVSSTVAAQ